MVGTKSMLEDLCLYCTILCQILQVHGNIVLKILYQRPRQNYQCLVQILAQHHVMCFMRRDWLKTVIVATEPATFYYKRKAGIYIYKMLDEDKHHSTFRDGKHFF